MRRPSLLFACLALPAAAQVSFHSSPGRIEIHIDGKPFSNLYDGAERAQPFLHPLRAASGVAVTRGYPVKTIEGESRDHHFHHGLWFTHSDINGVDFWRDQGPEQTGRMVAIRKPAASRDTLSGQYILTAPGGGKVGAIEQTFRFAAHGALRIVDVQVTLRADQGAALKLGDTEEAGLGFRFRDEFREDRGAVLSNSEGLVGSRNIWGKRAAWVDYSTVVDKERVGVTIFDHPGNPRYPTYWHARNYGFCAANAFGERSFTRDALRDGTLRVPEGGSVTFRYRVVVHPGGIGDFDAAPWAASFAKEQP